MLPADLFTCMYMSLRLIARVCTFQILMTGNEANPFKYPIYLYDISMSPLVIATLYCYHLFVDTPVSHIMLVIVEIGIVYTVVIDYVLQTFFYVKCM